MVKLLITLLLLILAALQYRLWVGTGSLAEVHQLEKQQGVQRGENDALRQRNQQLEAEVDDLKTGLDAIEERARAELGMVGKDETFYMVVEPRAEDTPPE